MILLAVDPSLRSSGVALFVDSALTSAAAIKAGCRESLPERCRSMANLIREWATGTTKRFAPSWTFEAVMEWPQVYRAVRSKGDPNDLLGLAGVCAALAAVLPLTRCTSYKPAEWAGQIPKSTRGNPFESMRGKRILATLTEEERPLVPKSHDAVDAVGIGLFHLGRFSPSRRVYPGAT